MLINDTHISVLDRDGKEILIEVPKTLNPQVIVEFENESISSCMWMRVLATIVLLFFIICISLSIISGIIF